MKTSFRKLEKRKIKKYKSQRLSGPALDTVRTREIETTFSKTGCLVSYEKGHKSGNRLAGFL